MLFGILFLMNFQDTQIFHLVIKIGLQTDKEFKLYWQDIQLVPFQPMLLTLIQLNGHMKAYKSQKTSSTMASLLTKLSHLITFQKLNL